MTKICCVCHRVEKGRHWREDYRFATGERVTHGYCPLCFDVIMAELRSDGQDVFRESIKEDRSTVAVDQDTIVCV